MTRVLVPALVVGAAILVFAVVNASAGHSHAKAQRHSPFRPQLHGTATQHHTPSHQKLHGGTAQHHEGEAQHHNPGHHGLPQAHGSATIHLVEHATTDAVTNGSATDSAGNILTFANDVFDSANANKVGTDEGSCVRTVVGKAWECRWTTFLPHGQITLEGPFYDNSDSTVAITGGTGVYRNVRGSMELKYRNAVGTEFDFIFHVIG
jgi:allene oxide cyclase